MSDVIQLDIIQFSLIYLLLLIVLFIMKLCHINQAKLLILASMRMTVQLVLAGFILSYIFENQIPIFTILYIAAMVGFSIWRVLSNNKSLNKRFKISIALSVAFSGLFVVAYFVLVVVRVGIFNPQYTVPISGMIFGNSMTGITLGLKTFQENIKSQRVKTETLLNLGVAPNAILRPYVNNALETAMLPTLNSMLGMGIVSLPGMMTGQILAGTLPLTAIMYQIAVMIAICTAVCLTVFCALVFGYRTMINSRNQLKINYYE